MARYTLPNPLTYTPQIDPSYFRFAVLPTIVECPRYPTLNFVSSRADAWNCAGFCGADKPYWSLYKFGDIIPLQFNLPDVRNINQSTGTPKPQIGWRQTDLVNNFWYVRAEIYDLNDCSTPLFELVDDFCTDWWVGYSDRVGSLQTLFIDTSLINVFEGFIIKIVTIKDDLTDNITLWSEPFMRIDRRASCADTLQIVSTYPAIDCENRDYRTPENDYTVTGAPIYAIKAPFVATGQSLTPFYSSWRYEAQVLEQGNSGEITLNDNDIAIRQRITRQYELQFTSQIPPYIYKIATAQLRAPNITIDGESYINAGDIQKNLEGSRMFLPSVPLEQVCDLRNLKC
jgi:hypothetical protein